MVKRIFFSLGLLLLFFSVPVWLGLVLSVVGCVLFRNYIEGVLIVLIYEIMFTPSTFHFAVFWTMGILCVLLLVEWIRPYVRK